MKLRLRLGLTTALVSLPLALGLVWWDERSQRRAAGDELIQFTIGLANAPGWRERCGAEPSTLTEDTPWPAGPPGGPSLPGAPPASISPPTPMPLPLGVPPPVMHRRPARFFAYGPDLAPHSPVAPPLPADIKDTLAGRDAVLLPGAWHSGQVRVLLRLPGPSGPCAFLLAEGTTEPWLGGVLPPTQMWLLPLLGVFAAVLLAVGPVLRRIQRLRRAVLASAESEYQRGVDLGGDDEIAELARAFDAAAEQVRAQLGETRRREEALREFLANTTHDIMIPLTVLQGHLAALRERPAISGESARDVALGHAMDEAHYLGALIHNLAIAAKLDASAPTLQRSPVDLCALVERVVSRSRPIARGLEVALDRALPADPLLFDADVTMIEQAVSNLVYNAVRYNRPGGHVAVILERAATGFVLSVIDDGPGIPEDELSQAVERGHRGERARARAPSGHGLGLAITNRVAKLHGLRLSFRRSEFGGLQADLST